MTLRPILPIALACALWPAISRAESPQPAGVPKEIVVQSLEHGFMLTDAKGMALYTYQPDRARGTRCFDACAERWPPMLVQDAAKPTGDWGSIARPDGARQLTYKGNALYRFSQDTGPLKAKGNGQEDLWKTAVFVPPEPSFVAPGEITARWDQPYYVLADVAGHVLYTTPSSAAGHMTPLAAPLAAKAVGDWRPVDKAGARYWSFKGRIVYTREDADGSGDAKGLTPIRLPYDPARIDPTRLAAR